MSAAAARLAERLSLPRVELFDSVGSTLDVAHALAANGAVAGTLIVADSQTAGRGRMGRAWRSESGAGVWMTIIERPTDTIALEVLSLRVGLAIAPELDTLARSPVRLKWPNDLYVAGDKLAGILIEVRWRESRPDWVAIGVGVNLRPPADEPRTAGLKRGTTRDDVLTRIVSAIRSAASKIGPLSDVEVAAFADRDLAAGRVCSEPAAGRVLGIDSTGALLVDVSSRGARQITAARTGSLVLEEDS